jgi:predicted DNA-binding transcriptional regulator
MRIVSDNVRKWLDMDAPTSKPLKLLENAPEEIKKEFEEWVRQCEDDDAKGIYG